MQNFKYCIWCLPEEGHDWYRRTYGYYPHISIKTNLELDEAILLFKKIKKDPLDIYLTDEIIAFNGNGFNALYYKVGTKESPDWWPVDAHISFDYRYNKLYTISELELFSKINLEKNCKITKYWIVRCEGHYMNWKNQIVEIYNNKI